MNFQLVIPIFCLSFLFNKISNAQIDSSLLKHIGTDTARQILTMDAVFNRPFLKLGTSSLSLGGYLETNWQNVSTSATGVGNQFQFRRLSLFIASSISKKIKFLSELEYENEGVDANNGGSFEIEYAAIDIEFNPLFNLRGGMIVNPVGAFNQNHDGPKWEFTDRPIAMTQMLPATWSNTGFGAYGKQYNGNWMFGYEFYVTGGLNDSIIDLAEGKLNLPTANENPSRFSKTASGLPMYNGKIALRNIKVGELGLSYVSDVYNTWQINNKQIDNKRTAQIIDIDFNTTIKKWNTNIITEWAKVLVQIPPIFAQQYTNKQIGGFMDIVQPIFKGRILNWDHTVINVAIRGEYVDWNFGNISTPSGSHLNNDTWSVMSAISFRPTAQTVLRFNYRHQLIRGTTNTLNGNNSLIEGFNVGISTYF